MNYEIAAIIILLSSLIGIGVILFRKIPALAELPEVSASHFNWKGVFLKLRGRARILNPFKSFSSEIFLQKMLSKIRILTLRTENKTDNWLQRLRKKAQKKKIDENDNYWEEVKNGTNEEIKSEEDKSQVI